MRYNGIAINRWSSQIAAVRMMNDSISVGYCSLECCIKNEIDKTKEMTVSGPLMYITSKAGRDIVAYAERTMQNSAKYTWREDPLFHAIVWRIKTTKFTSMQATAP